jgi:hypothetical protein
MTGESVPEVALHAGDTMAVRHHMATIAAVVVSIERRPPCGDDVMWEATDHSCSGFLHCKSTDLVNRLSVNRMVS